MLWKPDPEATEARNLPDWGRFHQVCGRAGFFFFDRIARGLASEDEFTALLAPVDEFEELLR